MQRYAAKKGKKYYAVIYEGLGPITGKEKRIRPIIAGSLTALLALLAIGCGSGNSLNADAGPDTKVAVGESPTFNGCDSSGDITNYQWIIRQTPESMPQDVDKAIRDSITECSFTLEASMIADEIGSWTIELIITDEDGATSSDDVVVTVVE